MLSYWLAIQNCSWKWKRNKTDIPLINDLAPFCDSDFIFAICRSLETGTKDRIINAVVSQQSTSANLTFYKFMPFCRNYHISLTAFITALFFLLVISSCSRFEWNVDFDHDIIPEIRNSADFFLQFCLYSAFFFASKIFSLLFFPINFNLDLIFKIGKKRSTRKKTHQWFL